MRALQSDMARPRLPIGVPVSSRGTFTSTKPTVPSAVRTPSARGSGSGSGKGASARKSACARPTTAMGSSAAMSSTRKISAERARRFSLPSAPRRPSASPTATNIPGEEPVYIV